MGGRCHRTGWVRKRFSWIVLLSCVALAGCASESELRRLDPALSEIDLRQGRIAVLGVVKFQEPDQIRPPLIAMLERAFREERRDIRIIEADRVRAALGEERYRRILLAYEYQGSLESSVLGEISDSLRGAARFILLARVEKDRTRNSARGVTPGDAGVSGSTYAIGVTGRDALVAVHLYDLSRKALAASARYEGSSENSRPVVSPVSPGGGSGATVEIGRAVPPEEQGYPTVPELAQALDEPFRTFARDLPGASLPAGTPPPGRKR